MFQVVGSTTLWPVAVSVGALPSIIYLTTSVTLTDSPYYFVRNNMMAKAEEVLRKLRRGKNVRIKLLLSILDIMEFHKTKYNIIIRNIFSVVIARPNA